jgi:glycosyltransferase involved in cell wall biosynthesis
MSQKYRFLIVTHASLAREQGAAQFAITLGETLKRKGHDVVLWSPSIPPATPWWKGGHVTRRLLDKYLATEQPFHLIDAAPLMLTRWATQQAVTVSRSVQPPFQYLVRELAGVSIRRPRDLAQFVAQIVLTAWRMAVVLLDWTRATHILALGQLEYEWMKKYFPFFDKKLSIYRPSLALEEQERLKEIRQKRRKWNGLGVKFLWIGRWAAHKGTDRLVQFLKARLESVAADTVTIAGFGHIPQGVIPEELVASGRVSLVAQYTREKLFELLETHHIGLFTSDVEGWGMSLNEMVEAGLPVFATNAGAVPDLQAACNNCIFPFPPPMRIDVQALQEQMELSSSYYERINWEPVVEMYERFMLKGSQNLREFGKRDAGSGSS